MDISKIDKNFAVQSTLNLEDIVWLNATEAPVRIHGAAQKAPYARVPADIAETVSQGVAYLAKNTAGIRARFRTDSPYIAIHAEWDAFTPMNHMPALGTSGFDLYALIGGEQSYYCSFIPPFNPTKGYESMTRTDGVMRDYILNFPLYNPVSALYIGVKEGSLIEPASDYSIDTPAVFYGSSITQGGCASRPGTCYQNILSRALDMDYVNLGFSGNAKGEKEIAEYIASLKMSAFVCDYDHNAPSAEHLKATHYPLYATIREKHPDTPYIIITKPDYHDSEAPRRAACFETYARAIAEGDKNVYFIDGASLFAGPESEGCTVDGCHPNDLGFFRMASGILPTFKRTLKA